MDTNTSAIIDKFISIEGGEGCGKTTLIQGLKHKFSEANIGELVVSREPGGTELGKRIRSLFTDPPSSEELSVKTELCLIAAARIHHIEHLILPSLKAGKWVLLDRFYDSSNVYQSAAFNKSLTADIWTDFTVGSCRPTLTIVCDIPVEIGRRRLLERAQKEDLSRIDLKNPEFHETIRQEYLKRAKAEPHRMKIIDASPPPEDVLEQTWEHILKSFPVIFEKKQKLNPQ